MQSTIAPTTVSTGIAPRPRTCSLAVVQERSTGRLVVATPFRAHVIHLMATAQVPWPLVAYQARVSPATVHTLLFGRDGRPRHKIDHQSAARLISVGTEDLEWMRIAQISAERAGARIRLLRSRQWTWADIGDYLSLDEPTCQAMARNECTSCSVMVDVLAHSACALNSHWDEAVPMLDHNDHNHPPPSLVPQ